MTSRIERAVALLALSGLVVAAGCARVGEAPGDIHETRVTHDAAGEHLEAQHEDRRASEAASPGDSSDALSRESLLFVTGWLVTDRLGPGGRPFEVARRTSERVGHQRTIGRTTYSIAIRSENLTYYPCSSCHVPGRVVVRDERVADVHQDIQPVHPAANNAVCGACHVSDDPARLNLVGTDPVPLNEAYRLCAQCHFLQVEAWAGGAHGKRLDTWRGPRVLMSCTDCHNPHDPGIPTRTPFPGPRVPRTGPKQP